MIIGKRYELSADVAYFFKKNTKMQFVQGTVFVILTEKNCLFLFRAEADKEIRTRFPNFDRSMVT